MRSRPARPDVSAGITVAALVIPKSIGYAGIAGVPISRTGNRQLNAAIHRIALTQARSHPNAIALIARRTDAGATRKEALRFLKRRLSDVVIRVMLADAALAQHHATPHAA